MPFAQVNWLAVIIAAIANMAVGFIWYSRPVFGNRWMALVGKRPEELGSPGPGYALTFVGALVAAYVLGLFVEAAGVVGIGGGALVGLLASIGFVATAVGASYIFEGRPGNLYLINVGYQVVGLVVMGAVFGFLG